MDVVGKSERKRSLLKLTRRWEDNITNDRKDTMGAGGD